MGIPVDDTWQDHWRNHDAWLTAPRDRKASNSRSKVGHLAIWVMEMTNEPEAKWVDCMALLDPETAPHGVNDYVCWKRTRAPGRRWNKAVSVHGGLAVLADFMEGTGDSAAMRIATAMRQHCATDV